MDPIVKKFTDEFIDSTGDLRQSGDIDACLSRLDIPTMLVTKIKDSL